jgi:hypothetical protein
LRIYYPRAADPSNKLNAGKSYVVFGKKDNTNAIELSDIPRPMT